MSYYNVELLEFFQELSKFKLASEELVKSSLKLGYFFARPPLKLLRMMFVQPRLRKQVGPHKWEDVGPKHINNYVSPYWHPPSNIE